MTKEELKDELRELAGHGDTEYAHGRADDAIMEFLTAEGHGDIVELYEAIDKWYA